MKSLHRISGKSDLKPNYFAISTDSKTLISNAHSLSSSEDQYETVKFWDLETGELVRTIDFRHDFMTVAACEKWLLGVVYNADVICRLALETNEFNLILDAAPRCLTSQRNNVPPLVSSPRGSLVGCGGQIQEVYDLLAEPISTDGYAVRLPAQRFNSGRTSSVLISPDSNFLLSQELYESSNYLWSIKTGQLVREFNSSSLGIAESLAVDDTGQLLVCSSLSDRIQVWEAFTGEIRLAVSGNLPMTMSADGRFLVYCDLEIGVIIWDVKMNQEVCRSSKISTRIEKIGLSPDGKWLTSYNEDHQIEIWSIF
jgi:WD40 repeat protein